MSNKDWIMAAVSEELQLSIEFVVNKQGEHSVNGTSISQNNSNYHTLQSLWKHSRWDIRIVYWKAGIVIGKQCTRRSKQSKDLQPVISEDSSPSSSQALGQSSAKKPRHSANSDPLQPNIIQSLVSLIEFLLKCNASDNILNRMLEKMQHWTWVLLIGLPSVGLPPRLLIILLPYICCLVRLALVWRQRLTLRDNFLWTGILKQKYFLIQ